MPPLRVCTATQSRQPAPEHPPRPQRWSSQSPPSRSMEQHGLTAPVCQHSSGFGLTRSTRTAAPLCSRGRRRQAARCEGASAERADLSRQPSRCAYTLVMADSTFSPPAVWDTFASSCQSSSGALGCCIHGEDSHQKALPNAVWHSSSTA
eukprot:TRINITY_DN34341_c0_g2_i1.p2 TRINITY_DN34341_c0_g2~~TRINITY_DN34341_c0_g2_i1.p2  ORF type:complete len:150 (-),score=3.22 TRINITY_DN34341_c0_g2_i1:86-535(-)